MDFDILLGPVINDAHMTKLEQVAAWLDKEAFSCTLAVYNGYAYLDVTPDEIPPNTNWDAIRLNLVETVVEALARNLVDTPAEAT